MALFANNFEGGTDGNTITTANSGGTSGDAFTLATGSGGTRVFTTSNVIHDSVSAHLTASASTQTVFIGWDNTFNTTSLVVRFYIKFLADTTANGAVIFQARGSSGPVCDITMDTGLSLRINNNVAAVTGSDYTVSLNTIYRIEAYMTIGSSTGRYKYAIYEGESTTPVKSLDATSQNMGTNNILHARFGKTGNPGSVDYIIDSMAVSDSATDFLGPIQQPSSYNPAAISGLIRRYKADDITSGNGTAVSLWPDSSGNAQDAVDAGGTLANPTKKAGILNGHAVVRFNDANNECLAFPLNSGLSVSFTYVVVASVTTFSNGPQTLIGGSGDYPQGIMFNTGAYGDAGKLQIQLAGSSTIAQSSSASTAGVFHSFIAALDATNNDNNDPYYLWLDGVNFGTGPAGSSGGTVGTISMLGAYHKSSGTPYDILGGDIAEVLIYDRALTSAEVAAVDSYIQDTYGITVDDYGQTSSSNDIATVAWLTA